METISSSVWHSSKYNTHPHRACVCAGGGTGPRETGGGVEWRGGGGERVGNPNSMRSCREGLRFILLPVCLRGFGWVGFPFFFFFLLCVFVCVCGDGGAPQGKNNERRDVHNGLERRGCAEPAPAQPRPSRQREAGKGRVGSAEPRWRGCRRHRSSPGGRRGCGQPHGAPRCGTRAAGGAGAGRRAAPGRLLGGAAAAPPPPPTAAIQRAAAAVPSGKRSPAFRLSPVLGEAFVSDLLGFGVGLLGLCFFFPLLHADNPPRSRLSPPAPVCCPQPAALWRSRARRSGVSERLGRADIAAESCCPVAEGRAEQRSCWAFETPPPPALPNEASLFAPPFLGASRLSVWKSRSGLVEKISLFLT